MCIEKRFFHIRLPFFDLPPPDKSTIPMQMSMLHLHSLLVASQISRDLSKIWSGLELNQCRLGLKRSNSPQAFEGTKERLSKVVFEAQLEGSLDYPNKQETAIGLEVYDTSRKLPICKAASPKPNQSNLEILAFSPLVWAVSIWLPVFYVSRVP